MAKDLPYFKFIISEWNDGDVTICSFEAQGLFINLCSIYWSQEGNLSFARAKRRFSGCNATAWEELVNEGIIKLDGDDVVINFLDEQLEERGKLSKTNSQNAALGWEKRRKNATALPSHSDPIEVACNIEEKRTEKKRKEEKREEAAPPRTIVTYAAISIRVKPCAFIWLRRGIKWRRSLRCRITRRMPSRRFCMTPGSMSEGI